MLRAIQFCLQYRVGDIFGKGFAFMLMVSAVSRHALRGFVAAILQHGRERGVQRKYAKQEDEHDLFHFAPESSSNSKPEATPQIAASPYRVGSNIIPVA